jgi:hypothetical protein
MHIRSTYALPAAALVISMAAATPTFGQGYAYPAAGRFMDSPYYAGSSYYGGSRYYARSRYVGSRYHLRATTAYGSVDGYGAPYRRYAYTGWYESRQNSDPDPRIGGSFKISDHNSDD